MEVRLLVPLETLDFEVALADAERVNRTWLIAEVTAGLERAQQHATRPAAQPS